MQPSLYIRVLDIEDQADLRERIVGFVYEDDDKKAATVTITVDSPELRFHQSPIWRVGTLFEVQWAVGGLASPARRMILPKTRITGSLSRFRAILHEAGVMLDVEPRGSRSWANATHSEVVADIARENGFADEQVRVQDTSTRYETVTRRADETDAAFVRRLGNVNRYEFWLDHNGWWWGERDVAQPPITRIGLEQVIGDVNIDEIKPDRPARVVSAAPNPEGGDALREFVSNAVDAARPGLAVVSVFGESAADTAGLLGVDVADVLQVGSVVARSVASSGRVVGERVDLETGETELVFASGVAPESRLAGTRVERAPQPGDRARGGYRAAQQGAVALSFTILGNPYILAKTVIELDLGDEMLSGRYWVRGSTHTLDDGENGYTTRLRVISDGHGGHSTAGDTSFRLSTGSRSKRTQDFETAERTIQGLGLLVLSVGVLTPELQAVQGDLTSVYRAIADRRAGSIQQARTVVARVERVARDAGRDRLAQAARVAGRDLAGSQRGETRSSAVKPDSQVSDGALRRVETIDLETGETVITYREG